MAHFRIRYRTTGGTVAHWHLRAVTKEEARQKFRSNINNGNIPDYDKSFIPRIKQVSNILNPFL